MAYDEALAERIRDALGKGRRGITEKKMFGGLAFLLDGKMFIGVSRDELLVRVGPERYEEALDRAHVRPMDFTGRPMKGYVFVTAAGCKTGKAIQPWVDQAAAFVAQVEPAKGKKKSKPKPKSKPRKRSA
ncbi:MAG TPA: TfoX/Sxy family protein [Myxococcales bacterium]|nr:TfoX/Sxy family protein [Myxococcales bacterium]